MAACVARDVGQSGFDGVWLQGKHERVALGGAGQGEENDEDDEEQDGENEDAAFRTGGSAAEDRFADGVGGE